MCVHKKGWLLYVQSISHISHLSLIVLDIIQVRYLYLLFLWKWEMMKKKQSKQLDQELNQLAQMNDGDLPLAIINTSSTLMPDLICIFLIVSSNLLLSYTIFVILYVLKHLINDEYKELLCFPYFFVL